MAELTINTYSVTSPSIIVELCRLALRHDYYSTDMVEIMLFYASDAQLPTQLKPLKQAWETAPAECKAHMRALRWIGATVTTNDTTDTKIKIAGFAICVPVEDDNDKSLNGVHVFVAPEYRNRGVGTALLVHMQYLAKTIGMTKLRIDSEAMIGNMRFYVRRGFAISPQPLLGISTTLLGQSPPMKVDQIKQMFAWTNMLCPGSAPTEDVVNSIVTANVELAHQGTLYLRQTKSTDSDMTEFERLYGVFINAGTHVKTVWFEKSVATADDQQ